MTENLPRVQNYSLQRRLLAAASILLLVFLGAMGWGLNAAFQQSVLSNAEDALRNQVLLLMSNIDVEDGQVVVPEVLSEPRLSQTDSEVYAQIESPSEGIVWRSPSLLDQDLPIMQTSQGVFKFSRDVNWSGNDPVYALSFGVVWETEAGDLPFGVQVAQHRRLYLERMGQYREQLVLWLSIIGISLLVLLLALLAWGLRPLSRVTRQVGEIESGKRQRFDEDYPLEVSRLTQNLNQLLNFEQQRIDRQRNTLGNLAHSLKTPLAVMRGLNYSEQNSEEAHRQLLAMQNIIDYQLQSASAIGRRRFAKPIDVIEPSQQLINSLQKLYRDKGITAEIEIDDSVRFYGDQGDWLDLIGNLLENAFKWSNSFVALQVSNKEVAGQTNSHRFATDIVVSDDGVGIDENLKASILQRGVRLDSQTPGHGLGLHIVKGIVEAYEGEIAIRDNSPRGTRFHVLLN